MLKLLTLLLLLELFPAGSPQPSLDIPCHLNPEQLCWTDWLDSDDPTGKGDFETLSSLYSTYPGVICRSPVFIEAVTVSGDVPASSTGQHFDVYSPSEGFMCKNQQEDCEDYKVRFACCCD